MSHVIIPIFGVNTSFAFFSKEHINVCAQYPVECSNTCGEVILREKVRCLLWKTLKLLLLEDIAREHAFYLGNRINYFMSNICLTVYTGDTQLMENM